MIGISKFGIKQTLDDRFENSYYHHSTKEDLNFRGMLNIYANDLDWLPFISQIQKEFDNITNQETDDFLVLQLQIEKIEDLARALSACEPNRYVKDERYRYDQDKVCKRATQLDFDLANHIIDLQRKIIQVIQNGNSCQKIRLVPNTNKTPINNKIFKPCFFPNTGFYTLPKKETQKKRDWFNWLR